MVTAITGATGFIGGVLASELTARGEKVRALVRKKSNTKQLEALGIELATGDVADPASLNDFLHGCDRLYHCAGLVTWDAGIGTSSIRSMSKGPLTY